MNNNNATITYAKTGTGRHLVTYANNEWAWVENDLICSCPRQSTAVGFWYYEPKTQALVVKYKGGDTYYKYEGVPFFTIFAMLTADSLGAFIAREVKPHFSVAA